MQSPPNTEYGRPKRIKLRLSAFLLLVGITLGVGIAKLSAPIATLRGQQQKLARLRSQKASLTAEHSRLGGYKQRLATAAGQEATARRRGYVRQGERRLVFVREESGASPSPENTPDRSY